MCHISQALTLYAYFFCDLDLAFVGLKLHVTWPQFSTSTPRGLRLQVSSKLWDGQPRGFKSRRGAIYIVLLLEYTKRA